MWPQGPSRPVNWFRVQQKFTNLIILKVYFKMIFNPNNLLIVIHSESKWLNIRTILEGPPSYESDQIVLLILVEF